MADLLQMFLYYYLILTGPWWILFIFCVLFDWAIRALEAFASWQCREQRREQYGQAKTTRGRAQRRAHDDGDGEKRQRTAPPQSQDPLATACNFLGIPTTHNEAAFRAAYRAAIRRVHPDLSGCVNAAQRVNAAADLIRRRKGWS